MRMQLKRTLIRERNIQTRIHLVARCCKWFSHHLVTALQLAKWQLVGTSVHCTRLTLISEAALQLIISFLCTVMILNPCIVQLSLRLVSVGIPATFRY